MSGSERGRERSPDIYRFAWGFYLLLAIVGVVWVGSREGVVPLSLFVAVDGWWIDLVAGAVAAILLVGAWWILRRRLAAARDLERLIAEALGPIELHRLAALALLSGFAEELFFRGAVQGSWGWVVATVLFALLHSGPGPAMRLWAAFAVVAGALFAGLMIWRGNLLAPVVAHTAVNLVHLRRIVVARSP